MVAPLVTAAGKGLVGAATDRAALVEAKKIARREAQLYRRQLQGAFTGEKPSWILYMVVGMVALFKDMSDLVFGAIPMVGLALAFVFGLCFSVTIFLLLTVFDRSGGAGNLGVTKKFVHRAIALISAVLIDMLPVISFLPVTTFSVIVLYWLAKREWKRNMEQSARSHPTWRYA